MTINQSGLTKGDLLRMCPKCRSNGDLDDYDYYPKELTMTWYFSCSDCEVRWKVLSEPTTLLGITYDND